MTYSYMKRFYINISTYTNTLQIIKPKLFTLNQSYKHHYLNNKIAYSFSKQNLSSRQIDIKISQQKWKNLQNNYKALKTSFGYHVPKSISKNYPTPNRIQFNLQALRQCSNQYPQYLFQQLKKQDSKFYQVIDASLNNLWKADKKEALQFILFIIYWKIHLKNQQIGQMILRTIKKMQLNLFQIFQLTKVVLKQQSLNEDGENVQNTLHQKQTGQTIQRQNKSNIMQKMDPIFKKMLVICENMIISRLQVIEPQQYEPLFKIVNLFRFYDVYPEIKQSDKADQKQLTFFQIIQKNLLKNIIQIPPSSLVIMAVHYANNTKQNQDQRIQILQKLQERIIVNMKFFNHQEMIAILYSYMRTSLLSKQFIEQYVQRIRLTYSEMSWENKKKILSLSSNFPQHQKILIISQAHNELIKGKPIITKMQDGSIKKQFDSNVFIDLDYQLVPEIYLASYQNNLLTQQLTKKMQQIILSNIYNYDRQQVVRSVWLFTVSPGIGNNLQRLHKKLEVIIEGGFQGGQYTVKDISIIAWSLCNSGSSNQQIYKPEAKFWDNIEFYLEQKLSKQQPNSQPSRISNVSSILWAYTFNRPLKFKTVSLISDILLQQMTAPNQQVTFHSFELINIITFYYSLPTKAFPKSIVQKIKQLCVQYFQSMYLEMNSLQLMKSLKYLAADEYNEGQTKLVIKIKVWQNIIKTFASQAEQIEYEHIMGIVGLVVNSPLGRGRDRNVMSLVAKLLKRKKSLQQIKTMQVQSGRAQK